jgi:Tol biopolymer transport system component
VRLADVFGVNLATGRKTTYRQLKKEYNEAEGIFPDGKYILVESDREQTNARGSKTLDTWKLRLEPNSTDFTRVTRFGDLPGYKATNPVVSPDGKTIAFQEGWTTDIAGSGHGVFLLRLR